MKAFGKPCRTPEGLQMQGRGCQYYRHHNVVLQMAVMKKISCLTNVALKCRYQLFVAKAVRS